MRFRLSAPCVTCAPWPTSFTESGGSNRSSFKNRSHCRLGSGTPRSRQHARADQYCSSVWLTSVQFPNRFAIRGEKRFILTGRSQAAYAAIAGRGRDNSLCRHCRIPCRRTKNRPSGKRYASASRLGTVDQRIIKTRTKPNLRRLSGVAPVTLDHNVLRPAAIRGRALSNIQIAQESSPRLQKYAITCP